VRELRAERTHLEMQLVVARVAAEGAVASEASARTSLEAARQLAEDRATTAETAAATAVTKRDSLASRHALAEAGIEKLRAAAASAEEAAEGAKTAVTTTEMPPRPPLVRRRPLRQWCRSWSVTWARPHQTWRRRIANSPRSPTNSKWPPRRQRGFVTPTP
jgi:hypothetical protein